MAKEHHPHQKPYLHGKTTVDYGSPSPIEDMADRPFKHPKPKGKVKKHNTPHGAAVKTSHAVAAGGDD